MQAAQDGGGSLAQFTAGAVWSAWRPGLQAAVTGSGFQFAGFHWAVQAFMAWVLVGVRKHDQQGHWEWTAA